MRKALITLALLAGLGGCQREQASPAPRAGASARAPSSPTSGSPNSASPRPAEARAEKIENDLIDFEYAYPAAAAAIPALRQQLDAELAKQKAALVASAKEERAAAKDDGRDYHPLGHWQEWQVVANLPSWLSLSAQVGTYEGGAHPNSHFETLLWDKTAGRDREPLALFDKPALEAAIRDKFCAALDRERVKRRGQPVKRDQMFGECIDPLEEVVILGSANGQAFDRIGVLIAPYEAGPYAEGSYEVTLPVTDAVFSAVKPPYRQFFAKGR